MDSGFRKQKYNLKWNSFLYSILFFSNDLNMFNSNCIKKLITEKWVLFLLLWKKNRISKIKEFHFKLYFFYYLTNRLTAKLILELLAHTKLNNYMFHISGNIACIIISFNLAPISNQQPDLNLPPSQFLIDTIFFTKRANWGRDHSWRRHATKLTLCNPCHR